MSETEAAIRILYDDLQRENRRLEKTIKALEENEQRWIHFAATIVQKELVSFDCVRSTTGFTAAELREVFNEWERCK